MVLYVQKKTGAPGHGFPLVCFDDVRIFQGNPTWSYSCPNFKKQSCWMDNSKARAISANNFPEVDFSATTKTY